jgi:hypothetical protein
MGSGANGIDIAYDERLGYRTGALIITNTPAGVDPARVRHYSPTVLKVYTNTIMTQADQRAIGEVYGFGIPFVYGVRPTLAYDTGATTPGLLYVGPPSFATYFIGPTNIGSTYDGATNLAPVAGSAWAGTYICWTTGKYVTVTTNTWSNSITGATTTNVQTYTNANMGGGGTVLSPFTGFQVNTNELAWHYSALYRLRDSLHATTAGAGTTWAVTNLYTNVTKDVEWYARSNAPAAWLLFDTSAAAGVGAVSTALGDQGWGETNVAAVCRWSQRACTNAIFDGRY